MKPAPIGSMTYVNTIGIVWVSFCKAAVTGLDSAKITSGCIATSSFAKGLHAGSSRRHAIVDLNIAALAIRVFRAPPGMLLVLDRRN